MPVALSHVILSPNYTINGINKDGEQFESYFEAICNFDHHTVAAL